MSEANNRRGYDLRAMVGNLLLLLQLATFAFYGGKIVSKVETIEVQMERHEKLLENLNNRVLSERGRK